MRRYIDADNLQRHGKRGGVVYWRDIEAQPTADVRENIKGEWLHKKTTNDYHVTGQCSNCHERRRIDNFCPNCGAEMRGDSHEVL